MQHAALAEIPFAAFPSIERLQQNITITEKIHGTNAQIHIGEDGTVLAGSRTRWITPDDDNFGFAAWVQERAEVFAAILEPGQHFGEWYGRGINAGYGMTERRFALFNTYRWTTLKTEGLLPDGVDVVPILYAGPFVTTVFDDTLAALRASGSVLVPGYMKPEGIVVRFDRSHVLMKRTFEAEDEAWNYKAPRPPRPDQAEAEAICAPFWQPLRLEKLLSRDERFARDYPTSLPHLVSAYVHDLLSETPDMNEATTKLVKKSAFKAIKGMMAEIYAKGA